MKVCKGFKLTLTDLTQLGTVELGYCMLKGDAQGAAPVKALEADQPIVLFLRY